MTFANVGTLGVRPGGRDEVVAILTRRLLSGQMGGNRFTVSGSPLRD